jgi:hypothetical protein
MNQHLELFRRTSLPRAADMRDEKPPATVKPMTQAAGNKANGKILTARDLAVFLHAKKSCTKDSKADSGVHELRNITCSMGQVSAYHDTRPRGRCGGR